MELRAFQITVIALLNNKAVLSFKQSNKRYNKMDKTCDTSS